MHSPIMIVLVEAAVVTVVEEAVVVAVAMIGQESIIRGRLGERAPGSR